MPDTADVVIIGGGVIGCACAYELSKRGASVIVVERGRVGYGCSYGNGGWIVPSHALPLPLPGALGKAARWMLDSTSPLYIKPRPSLELARWLLEFLSHANEKHLRYAAPILVRLATRSLERFEEFVAEHGAASIGYRQLGLIYACNSEKGLEGALREMTLIRSLGVPARELSAAEVREMQPALSGPLTGGVFYEKEAQAEPLRAVETMARLARQQGVTIREHDEVFDMAASEGEITSLNTTQGRILAGQYVLAAGSWTPLLARKLGIRVPIEAGKGYALIVGGFSPAVRLPTALVERKVGVTPRANGTVRLAGTMELAGLNESINTRRVEAIVRGARAFFQMPDSLTVHETWRGLRPCTPDGLPIIGRPEGWKNLVIASGHAMLGLTLSTGTAEMVAELIAGATPRIDPEPFRPSRF